MCEIQSDKRGEGDRSRGRRVEWRDRVAHIMGEVAMGNVRSVVIELAK